MQKIKIALSALVVFAVVGSALAFAPATYTSSFCVSSTGSSGGTCTTVTNKKIDEINGTQYFRDSTPGTSCDSGDSCTESVLLATN